MLAFRMQLYWKFKFGHLPTNRPFISPFKDMFSQTSILGSESDNIYTLDIHPLIHFKMLMFQHVGGRGR